MVDDSRNNQIVYQSNQSGFGLGAMMGLDDTPSNNILGNKIGEDFDDIGQNELDALDNYDEQKSIPIRMFIVMDEDDRNSKNINVNSLFAR